MDTSARNSRRTEADHRRAGEWTDEELLVRYRRVGDRDSFAVLVRRYERELFNYLRRYLGDAEMAMDVFQSAFLQVHLKCRQFQEDRTFRPWLYAIATHQAIDAQRRNKRHRMVSLDHSGSGARDVETAKLIDLLVSSEPDPPSSSQRAEQREWIREALNDLSDTLRSVVVLVYFQGLKYREAAEALDIPVGTVKSRLHSAVFHLTEAWKKTHARQK